MGVHAKERGNLLVTVTIGGCNCNTYVNFAKVSLANEILYGKIIVVDPQALRLGHDRAI